MAKPPRTPKTHPIAQQTHSRRSLLQWLGGGAVLTLGGGLLAACEGGSPAGPAGSRDAALPGPDAWAGADGRIVSPEAGSPDLTQGDLGASGGFSFAPGPGNHPVFSGWGERTVDKQDLQAILAGWSLKVDGLVEAPRSYSFTELLALQRTDMTVDFHCVEGWSIYDVPWNGIHLSRIFAAVKPKPAATHVVFHTLGDLYDESLPIAVALEPRTLLCYGIAGSTLPLKHGFPLRIVIPRLLGYKSAKYVYRIELADEATFGFWVKLGYPYKGEVPPARLRPGKY